MTEALSSQALSQQQALLQQSSTKDYKWFNSNSLPLEIQCGIIRLEVSDTIEHNMKLENLYVTSYIVCNQLCINEPPQSTLFSQTDHDKKVFRWDQIITFPIKIRDLSLDALLVLTVWSASGEIYGGTSMRLFDDDGCLKQGKQKLLFFPSMKGDPNVVRHENETMGDYYDICFGKEDYPFQMEKTFEKYRVKANMPRTKHDTKNEWLDRLLLKRIEQIRLGSILNSTDSEYMNNFAEELWGNSLLTLEMKKYSFLIIEMPSLQCPIIYEDKQYSSVEPHYPPTSMDILSKCLVDKDEQSMLEFSLVGRPFNPNWLTIVADWDIDQENLCEEQNRRLRHDVRRGTADSSIKPNKDEKFIIDKIIQAVGNQMSTDEMNFLYRFRYSLTDNKKALIKFLFTVNWDEESEVDELPILLGLWKQKAPIDVADALKLLSKDKSFEHRYVREYAVDVLRSASDEELLTFLLQLVQALRYEPALSMPVVGVASGISKVVDYNLEKSIIGIKHLNVSNSINTNPSIGTSSGLQQSQELNDTLSPLGKFLVERACNSSTVANFLYWYLKVETEDEQSGQFYQGIFDAYIVQLSTHNEESKVLFKRLLALDDYMCKILACQKDAQGRSRDLKEKGLIANLVERKLKTLPSAIEWVPMPLDPCIRLSGLNPTSVKVFSSAIYPYVVEFYEYEESPEGDQPPRTHKILFKTGDDLRQDQLIMQMVFLMDSLLKKVNLDLKLLTYGILAIGQKDGIMEFVQNSVPISAILKNFGSISDFLRHHNPDKNGPYEISPLALDTYIKSCAGYCVITFILGIGDRHLDNVMMTQSGQFFHIDFGFIFGQNPKPFPPPFRLNKPMIDAMGGEDSEHYIRFKTFCCQSYNWLRKSANLILNLLSLMGDAGIQDISKRSDLPRVLQRVEEKFRLDLDDEQAEQYFLGLINESLNSLATKVFEVTHRIAVAIR